MGETPKTALHRYSLLPTPYSLLPTPYSLLFNFIAMTFTTSPIQEFIASVSPFNQLPTTALEKLSAQLQPVHYHLGETILMREKIPSHVVILYQGQARLLGYDPRTKKEVTVQKLSPGAILGWASLAVRQKKPHT
ncbi:hypothetical protein BJP34_12440 [Moorena producens PAL-8-15-08-1]|uniref:Cyclic nucleotide-binding domain-containing protein n=2 Tax=Moorena TaxID=1155738 RepID=A0A1D8TR78_9CYAN|nr:hypothetical protein BJP34_12440 [Moorena producens PAL-8-15-08-1]